MAKPTFKEAAADVQFYRWLHWQMLRRSSGYHRAVATLRQSLERRANKLRAALSTAESQAQTSLDDWEKCGGPEMLQKRRELDAISIVRNAYRLFEVLPETFSQEQVREMGAMSGTLYRWISTIFVLIEGACRRAYNVPAFTPLGEKQGRMSTESLSPELALFEREWGMRFPLPPVFPVALEQAFTQRATRVHPVTIISSSRCLRLNVRFGLPRELLLAFIDGAIHHHIPHTIDWKAQSRKTSSRTRPEIKIVPQRNGCRVTIRGLIHGELHHDKASVREVIAPHLPKSILRLRNDEIREMFSIVDARSESPQPSLSELVKKYFPDDRPDTAIDRVRERMKRYKQLQAAFRL